MCAASSESADAASSTKQHNGSDMMNKCSRKQKNREYKKLAKQIDRNLNDRISRTESKILLHVLINRFDGFARQQNLVNEQMSRKHHWGNKRTARVLRTLAEIGVIDRDRSESDNWTLFFIVRGFLEGCRDRIIRAVAAIRERLSRRVFAIPSLRRVGWAGFVT